MPESAAGCGCNQWCWDHGYTWGVCGDGHTCICYGPRKRSLQSADHGELDHLPTNTENHLIHHTFHVDDTNWRETKGHVLQYSWPSSSELIICYIIIFWNFFSYTIKKYVKFFSIRYRLINIFVSFHSTTMNLDHREQWRELFQKSFNWADAIEFRILDVAEAKQCALAVSQHIYCIDQHKEENHTLKRNRFFTKLWKFRLFLQNDSRYSELKMISWFAFRTFLSSADFIEFGSFPTKSSVSFAHRVLNLSWLRKILEGFVIYWPNHS